ncbi:MAG: UDP-N-acetylglucosamine--N-acetylmuramyl-(pentapeptide) pyrophosphoryl-undecaprenol N-acetylglucosamine transferase [Bacteroides sp.]|nr:UDP-N-acetylglucosamine--N-acetylmuramyl-(pentapeptide) pyrophosphoryl-undecaprenol N-acetylglucosamine transferase [Prevotella sp.]MCM1408296.1 UDP-N-acetylglucosamine--N-acetylmuramyl-(pentapeptide) pyrophosphoryl-undecaprenol N-acetylglucosamine transferase [Treponema brennaborense]MCM1470472.1 UDP-N-acetylglucosamine--N-acetylmuramyl-(pentapeptide) pyrophosphoryl-undecaprenol N-acetylglucosamine transferase [Bacteroides sp.]
MTRIACVGGGTGGHIYPGLAVAAELRSLFLEKNGSAAAHELEIIWIGACGGSDRELVEKSGCADRFIGVPSGKLRRYFSLKNISDICKVAAGFAASFFILLKLKPALLFSKGGFVSVPPCLAARLLRIPVYTHECDVSPGLATRINARAAEKILVSFPDTVRFFPQTLQRKVIVAGNPVRPVFYAADKNNGKAFLNLPECAAKKPLLLVLGGSSGARQINELTERYISWLCDRFFVVHQTGKANNPVCVSAEQSNFYRAYPFIYGEMPDVMAAADIILSRAGAGFLWECAAVGKPAVLLPLAGSGSRGDQVENAAWFARHGAAVVLDGSKEDGFGLKAALEKMLEIDVRESYAQNARSLACGKKPARVIAEMLYDAVYSGETP